MPPPWPQDPCRVCGEPTSRMHRETDCIKHLKSLVEDLQARVAEIEEWVKARRFFLQDDGK